MNGDVSSNGHGSDEALDAAQADLDEREAALEPVAAADDDAVEVSAEGDQADAADELTDADPVAEAEDDLAEEAEMEDGETPDPLEHAAPDAEIAESRIALGALEASEAEDEGDEDEGDASDDADEDAADDEDAPDHDASDDADEDEDEDEDDLEEPSRSDDDEEVEEIELAPVPASAAAPAPRRRRRSADSDGESRKEVEVHRVSLPTRLVHFVQGSWKELQRVQWPDRRQVMQATGVVLGFVVVAGAYLGAADWLAGKLVNWIIG